MEEPLLSIQNLRVQLQQNHSTAEVIRGVELEVNKGEIVGLVGESGSGKTMTALSVLQLLPPSLQISAGTIKFNGLDLLKLSRKELQGLRGGSVAMIFQDPLRHLNPVFTVGQQLEAVISAHSAEKLTKKQVREKAIELFNQVKINDPERRLRSYPHQFSGGMAQRVMIAMALSGSPKLLLADEPTAALDVTVQAEILRLLKNIARERGMAVLFISHNLGAVWQLCDRVCVMYAGQVVETAATHKLIEQPEHPYTQALLEALPRLELKRKELASIPGTMPGLADMPEGCAFHTRCAYALPECRLAIPELLEMGGGHLARCIRAGNLPQNTESAA